MTSGMTSEITMKRIGYWMKIEFWLLTLATIIFFPSAYLQRSSFWSDAYDYARDIVSIIGVTLWLTYRGRQKTTLWMFLLALFYFEIELSSLLNDGFNISMARYGAYAVGFCALLDSGSEQDMVRTVEAVRRGLELLFWINLASIILKPQGLYIVTSEINVRMAFHAFFLGHRNNSIELYIPLVCLSGVEAYLKYRKLDHHTAVLCIAAVISNILTWSANALLCMVFVSACFLLLNAGMLRRVSATTYALVSLFATIALTQTPIIDSFDWLVTGILHKSMTMSGRTLVWERSIAQIKTEPIFGFGIESTATKFLKIGTLNSCHNYFLDILYYGGFVLLTIVVCFFLISYTTGNNPDLMLENILSTGAGAYAILWVATPIHRGTIHLMFAFWLIVYKLRRRNTEGSMPIS